MIWDLSFARAVHEGQIRYHDSKVVHTMKALLTMDCRAADNEEPLQERDGENFGGKIDMPSSTPGTSSATSRYLERRVVPSICPACRVNGNWDMRLHVMHSEVSRILSSDRPTTNTHSP